MGSIQQVNSAMGAARPGLPGWKLILALGKLGLQKRVPHLVRLLFATTASLLVWRWMQNILGPRKEKTMGMKAKDLATAPSLNKFHFFWSNKGIAEVLISEFKRFSDSGSNLGCIWFGSKKFVVATHPKTAKEILTNGKVFKKANVLTFLESPIRVFYTDENDKRLPDMVCNLPLSLILRQLVSHPLYIFSLCLTTSSGTSKESTLIRASRRTPLRT